MLAVAYGSRHRETDDAEVSLRLAGCASVLNQVAAYARDRATARRAADILASLPGKLAQVNAAAARQRVELLEGRALSEDPMGIVDQFMNHPDLSEFLRRASAGVYFHFYSVHLAALGHPGAHQAAAVLEAGVPGIWLAAHLQWLGDGFACAGAALQQSAGRAVAVSPDDLWRPAIEELLAAGVVHRTGFNLAQP